MSHTAGAMQVDRSSSPADSGAGALPNCDRSNCGSAAQRLTATLFGKAAEARNYTEEQLYGAQRTAGTPMSKRLRAQIENVDFGHKMVPWQAGAEALQHRAEAAARSLVSQQEEESSPGSDEDEWRRPRGRGEKRIRP